jgi:hypothetical protein
VPDFNPGLAELIKKAMAREPAHRFQTADEFKKAIEDWAQTGEGVGVLPAETNRPGMASMPDRSGAQVAQPVSLTGGAPAQAAGLAGAEPKARGVRAAVAVRRATLGSSQAWRSWACSWWAAARSRP